MATAKDEGLLRRVYLHVAEDISAVVFAAVRALLFCTAEQVGELSTSSIR